MIVHGREIKFKRTVGANIDIANICPNGDIKHIDQLFNGNYQHSQVQVAKFMSFLSTGYENNKAFEDKKYTPNPLTVDEALLLEEDEFSELFDEALEAWTGEKTTVETKEPKPVKGSKKKVSE